jgi:hypothetical protein
MDAGVSNQSAGDEASRLARALRWPHGFLTIAIYKGRSMNGYGFLASSLVIAAAGIGLYLLGPQLDRWDARLRRDIARLRDGHQQR